jgi:hypothetical protein
MKMKRIAMLVTLIALLGLPTYSMAAASLLKGEAVTVEGTIQGLLSACTGQLCVPGEENIVAAAEDTFVLSVGKNTYYFLPNLKTTLLSRYLGKSVKVIGVKALGGNSIIVDTIVALEAGGAWEEIYSPKIREQIEERYRFSPYPVS